MSIQVCECDRKRVCTILGECLLHNRLIQKLPNFLAKEKKNARSAKQALQLFKYIKFSNGKKADTQTI